MDTVIVLPVVEPDSDRSANAGPPVARWSRSWLVSLSFHAGLLLLLWWLVWSIPVQPSIELSASPSGDGEAAELQLAASAMPAEIETDIAESAQSQDSPADVTSQLQSLQTPGAEPPKLSEPNSIEFFGTHAYGDHFVFILDFSYSMQARRGARFQRAADELLRSVSKLSREQSYYVFLFSHDTKLMFYDRHMLYAKAVTGHQSRLRKWLDQVNFGSGTDPRRALALAHQMQPDAVFLLSDGEFNEPNPPKSNSGWIDEHGNRVDGDVLYGIDRWYRRIPVHTIAFENPFFSDQMERIAAVSGGRYRYVPVDALRPVHDHRFQDALREIAEERARANSDPLQYKTRIYYARHFMGNGQYVYAEYVLRPLRDPPPDIPNPKVIRYLWSVLDKELGEARLEDYRDP